MAHIFLGSFVSAMYLVALFRPETSIAVGICALAGFVAYVSVMLSLMKLMDRWDREDTNG
jgi:amino acid transporter